MTDGPELTNDVAGAVERDKLLRHFNSPEGYGTYGYNGDVEGWSPAETAIQAMEELRALKADHARLVQATGEAKSALEECYDYFDGRSDVADGDYGIPAPNAEMSLLQSVETALSLLQEGEAGNPGPAS